MAKRITHTRLKPVDLGPRIVRPPITPAKYPLLHAAQQIITDLEPYWPVSVRQVHYALLNNPPLIHAAKPGRYKNNRKCYDKIVELLARARVCGDVAQEAIADDTRPVHLWDVHDDVPSFVDRELEGFLQDYSRDLQQSQPDHVEVVVEKNTMLRLVSDVAAAYAVTVTSGRGYCSIRPKWDIVQRYRRSGKRNLILLAVTDFDPEGEGIVFSLGQRIRDDYDVDPKHIVVYKAALTQPQTKKLKFPDNTNVKETSPLAKTFIEKYHSKTVYELEALQPEQLQGYVRDALDDVLDGPALQREQQRQKKDRKKLQAMRERVADDWLDMVNE